MGLQEHLRGDRIIDIANTQECQVWVSQRTQTGESKTRATAMQEDLTERKLHLEDALITAVAAVCRKHGFRRARTSKSLVKTFPNGNLGIVNFQSTDRTDIAALRVTAGVGSARLSNALFPKKRFSARDMHLGKIIEPRGVTVHKQDNIWDSWFQLKSESDVAFATQSICSWLEKIGYSWIDQLSEDEELVGGLMAEGDRMARIYAAILNAIVNGAEPDLSEWLGGIGPPRRINRGLRNREQKFRTDSGNM